MKRPLKESLKGTMRACKINETTKNMFQLSVALYIWYLVVTFWRFMFLVLVQDIDYFCDAIFDVFWCFWQHSWGCYWTLASLPIHNFQHTVFENNPKKSHNFLFPYMIWIVAPKKINIKISRHNTKIRKNVKVKIEMWNI